MENHLKSQFLVFLLSFEKQFTKLQNFATKKNIDGRQCIFLNFEMQ
jgi:hypothetical protein